MRRPSLAAFVVVAVVALVSWCSAAMIPDPGASAPAPRIGTVPAAAAVPLPASADRGPSRPGAGPGPVAAGPVLAGGAAPVGRAAPRASRPAQVIDLADWYLTLPTGSSGDPDTVRQPALATYSGPFFQLDAAGDGIVFTANAGGATTANSNYPRSELREMNGDELASWSNTSGTHTLAVRQAVTALPAGKPEVVTAQIHDSSSDVVEIRLEGQRLIAQYDDGGKEFVLDPAYRLGTPYDLRIVAADGRIDVWYGGVHAGTVDRSGSGWYFKTGSYVQSNTGKGDDADAIGTVVLYAATVTHT